MKKNYAERDKIKRQKKKRVKYGHSDAQTAYDYNGHKVEMNAMAQQSSESAINLFVKKVKAVKKRKAEADINNINNELEYMSLTGYIISEISSTEDPTVDAWNIGLEYNKYGTGMAKIHCIDSDCISEIRNSWSNKNIKEVIDNYSFTQPK